MSTASGQPARRRKAQSDRSDRPARAGSTRKVPGAAKDAAAIRRAARFTRARTDHSSEIAEDYVELIAQLIRETGEARTVDIARRLGVSHVTVTKTITRLQAAGLVRSEKYRAIFLTDEGRAMAQRSEARHALLVRFLRELGVPEADAEADVEGMEHHVSDVTVEAIKRFLDRDSG